MHRPVLTGALSCCVMAASSVMTASARQPSSALDVLTAPTATLPAGCALAPAPSERIGGGRVVSGFWFGLPVRSNPWAGEAPKGPGRHSHEDVRAVADAGSVRPMRGSRRRSAARSSRACRDTPRSIDRMARASPSMRSALLILASGRGRRCPSTTTAPARPSRGSGTARWRCWSSGIAAPVSRHSNSICAPWSPRVMRPTRKPPCPCCSTARTSTTCVREVRRATPRSRRRSRRSRRRRRRRSRSSRCP